MTTFLAIDFETANYSADSACAVGLVRVAGGAVVDVAHRLIRPPSRQFAFTWLHGIAWRDVAGEPDFAALWPDLELWFEGVDFVAAHNAPFDHRVLDACCATYGLAPPRTPWVCTVVLARTLWKLRPTKLPDVCRYLAIPLDHHKADSDAWACAEIVIAAEQDGWQP